MLKILGLLEAFYGLSFSIDFDVFDIHIIKLRGILLMVDGFFQSTLCFVLHDFLGLHLVPGSLALLIKPLDCLLLSVNQICKHLPLSLVFS